MSDGVLCQMHDLVNFHSRHNFHIRFDVILTFELHIVTLKKNTNVLILKLLETSKTTFSSATETLIFGTNGTTRSENFHTHINSTLTLPYN